MLRLIALRLGRQKAPRTGASVSLQTSIRSASSSASHRQLHLSSSADTPHTSPPRSGRSRWSATRDNPDDGSGSDAAVFSRASVDRAGPDDHFAPIVRPPKLSMRSTTPKFGVNADGRRVWSMTIGSVSDTTGREQDAESSTRGGRDDDRMLRSPAYRQSGDRLDYGLPGWGPPRRPTDMATTNRGDVPGSSKFRPSPTATEQPEFVSVPIDRIIGAADELSSTSVAALAETNQVQQPEGESLVEARLDDFFAGHAEGRVTIAKEVQAAAQHETAKHFAPAPLATYTPPEESGVAMVKRFMLEHKFLKTQEIWTLGTGHLKPKIAPTQQILPDGRIRMKRVHNKREGKKIWTPPAEAAFPHHPFRSVRFLKETLLHSLEEAGVIHKSALTVPLETEAEMQEAMQVAERANRKREKRALHDGLPAPPILLPATNKVIWGWMLGPKPVHEERADVRSGPHGALKEEQPARRAWSEVVPSHEAPRIEEAQPYPGYGLAAAARAEQRAEEARVRREDRGILQDVAPTFGSTDPQAKLAAAFRDIVTDGLRDREDLNEHEGPVRHGPESTTAGPTPAAPRTLTSRYRSLEEVLAQEDWHIDHAKWQEAEKAEWSYHRAKFIAAQETAERQYVRRARLREMKDERRRQREEDAKLGILERLKLEKRRADAIRDIEHYAQQTGQDVSGWYDELLEGELGYVAPYEPVIQARGGTVGRAARARGIRPFGFPIK